MIALSSLPWKSPLKRTSKIKAEINKIKVGATNPSLSPFIKQYKHITY